MNAPGTAITRRVAAALAIAAPLGLVSTILADDGQTPGPAKESGAKPSPYESWWADLEKSEVEATRALLKMGDRRDETIAFLKARMKPLKIDAAEVRKLLLKLGNESETVWKPAFEELEYFDPRLAIGLEELMERYKEAPGRQRMVEVMSGRTAGQLAGKTVDLWKLNNEVGFNFAARPNFGSWWAEHKVERINHPEGWANPKKKWTRAVRAIVLLEHFGTPGAVAILKDMATGHPDAQPTRVAKDALARWNKPV